jgi:non-ribosomal peptide synthetase component F
MQVSHVDGGVVAPRRGAGLTATNLNDDTIWGLPGAVVDPPIPGVEAFTTTPLLDHLRAAAARDPGAVALAGQAAELRYADLLRLSLNVAGAVAARVPAGRAVACHLPRSPEGVAAVLGCLISGRVCLILDPTNPPDRQAALLADAAPAAVLVAEGLPCESPAPVLPMREAMAHQHPDSRPDPAWDPDAPLVVHYTSGSSGRPKGIVLSARSVLLRAAGLAHSWALTQDDRILGPSVPVGSAGPSILFAGLSCAARVVLSDLRAEGAGAVLRLVEQQAVTCAALQPAVLRLLFQHPRVDAAFRHLRSLRIGAAALPRADLAAWRAHLPLDCSILHPYSSTEALEIARWAVPPDDAGDEATVAAGRLQCVHDYALLGEDDRPVARGEAGELVLRSRCVALGEWQGGRLVPGRMPPVAGRPGWRFFRTGDLLRVQPDGMMRVLGRADRQVKINGFRVEPAEIEAVLRAVPGVADAAVVATTASDRVTLHGFVAATDVDPAALVATLRERLAAGLPPRSRPSSLVVLDRLPTLPGGKIDLLALTRLAGS